MRRTAVRQFCLRSAKKLPLCCTEPLLIAAPCHAASCRCSVRTAVCRCAAPRRFLPPLFRSDHKVVVWLASTRYNLFLSITPNVFNGLQYASRHGLQFSIIKASRLDGDMTWSGRITGLLTIRVFSSGCNRRTWSRMFICISIGQCINWRDIETDYCITNFDLMGQIAIQW